MDFDPFKEKARPIPNLGKGPVATKRNTQSDYMPVSSNKAIDDVTEEEETLTGELKITQIAFDDVAHAIGSNTTFSGEIEVLQKPIEREILVSLIAQDAQGKQEIVQDSLSFQAEGNSFAGEIFLGNTQLLLDAQQQDPKATVEYTLKAQNQSAKDECTSEAILLPQKAPLWVQEMEDIAFRTNSALLLPSSEEHPRTNSFLHFLGNTLKFAQENPDLKLLLCGHADSSGEVEYNRGLSALRAQCVYTLLANDINSWKELFASRKQDGINTYRDEDIQHLLTFFSEYKHSTSSATSWNTDPNGIDGKLGNNSKKAIKAMQEAYNTCFDASISVDGAWGKQCFEAAFFILQDILSQTFEDGAEPQANLNWLFSKNESRTPCGETHPILKKERERYRSQADRRVEILFFPADASFDLPCTATPFSESNCLQKECPIYGKDIWEEEVIPSNDEEQEYTIAFELTDTPLAQKKFQLFLAEELIAEGATNENGEATFSLNPKEQDYSLEIDGYPFDLTFLKTLEQGNALADQAKLNNLGYLNQNPKEEWCEDSLSDLACFEQFHHLEVSDKSPLKPSLQKLHVEHA